MSEEQKPPDKPPNPRHRPKIELDARGVRKLASYGCTTREIAEFFDVSSDTIERNFHEPLESGRQKRNANLRAIQFQLATKSAAMAIFLGKNYLGQKDVVEIEDKTGAAAKHAELIRSKREARLRELAEKDNKPPAESTEVAN